MPRPRIEPLAATIVDPLDIPFNCIVLSARIGDGPNSLDVLTAFMRASIIPPLRKRWIEVRPDLPFEREYILAEVAERTGKKPFFVDRMTVREVLAALSMQQLGMTQK